jgi:hypothetical protein
MGSDRTPVPGKTPRRRPTNPDFVRSPGIRRITGVDADGSETHRSTQRESRTMYHLMNNLPVLGTLGVAAVLVGPLARLPIDLGAWLLDLLFRWICETETWG